MSRRTVIGGLAFLSACGRRDLGGLTAGESGRVVRIYDGDALALSTGLSVRLAEIEAPRGAGRDREADPHGEASSQMLELLALGREAQLSYGGLTRDRYDRAIAHVTIRDETGRPFWLNGYMVRQGGARVRTWADNAARVRELQALEQEARRAGAGLWALSKYAVLSPPDMYSAGRGLMLVEGLLSEVRETTESRSFLAPDRSDSLILSLGFGLARVIDRLPVAPGVKVRCRGLVRRRDDGAPYFTIDHWGQVELLDGP